MASVPGLEREVAGALLRAGFSGSGTTLVVAASGGPDSSALLHCLHRLSEPHQLSLHVAHLDHNFRGEEAHEDARFVTALAHELNLGYTVEERDVLAYQRQRHISSFEQAAREFRYAFLAEVAGKVGAGAVAVGHTSDDLAETVLLHILRGSGSHGLRGMSEVSPWPWPQAEPKLKLFRPLLRATKTDTVGYCQELGKGYREDSGNYLPRFARNRVRLSLLPLLASEYNPRIRESLVRLSRSTALELDYLEGEIDRLWEQLALDAQGAVGFDQPTLASLHPALVSLLLRRAFAHLTGDARRLGQRHLDALAKLVRSTGTGRSLDLPGGLKFHRSYDHVWLTRQEGMPCPFPTMEGPYFLAVPSAEEGAAPATAGPWRISLRAGDFPPQGFKDDATFNATFLETGAAAAGSPSQPQSWTGYFDRAALGDQVQVRAWQAGDRFRPLGLGGEKKLQDFFTDAKVPRAWRDRVPLLVAQQGIAWVVGYRIADWAKVPQVEPGAPGLSPEILEVTFSVDT